VPAAEHGVFPPFDSQTYPSQLLWLTLTFVALYLLMSRIALPRIGSILEERRKHVDDHLEQARRLKGESEAALAAHETALAEARTRAQTLANEARVKAATDGEARRNDLEAKLETRIAEAETTLTVTRSDAMTNVHGIAEEVARAIVERLTGIVPEDRDVVEALRDDPLKR
jgi:F-type H+-transporting ATPase subunit b